MKQTIFFGRWEFDFQTRADIFQRYFNVSSPFSCRDNWYLITMSFQLSFIGRLFLLQSFYRKKTSNISWTNKAFFTGPVQLKILYQLCLKIVKAYQRFAQFLYSTLEKIISQILQFSASLKKKKEKETCP